MRAAKCRDTDYIDFLIATARAAACTEAAAVQPDTPQPPAHDAFTRLLRRLDPDPEALWCEAEPAVRKAGGVLVVDDSTLDKPYAEQIELVACHWSGKHKRVIWGSTSSPCSGPTATGTSPATNASTTRPTTS